MLLLLLISVPQVTPVPADSLFTAILAAEDARGRTPVDEATLLAALRHPDPEVQRIAVRAVGRLERADFLNQLAPMLAASFPTVRQEAANAVAQAAWRNGADAALGLLRARHDVEPEGTVRAELLASAGRLAVDGGEVAGVAAWLAGGLTAGAVAERAGAARGLYHLLRRQNRGRSAAEEVVRALRRAAVSDSDDDTRRLALLALLTTARLDSATAVAISRDRDPQIRMFAAQAIRTHRELPGRAALAEAMRHDDVALVRIEAIRAMPSPGVSEQLGCAPLIEALDDPSRHVQLLAIEALGQGCAPATPPIERLDAIAQEPITPAAWHRPAAAIVALAAADTARAAIRVGRFAASPVWWARVAAARAAARLGDTATLERLVADSVDNVREAALLGLAAVSRPLAETAARAQLGRHDYQLLLAAARLLHESTLGPVVAGEALAAFWRVTADSAETSRDTRLALLDRVEEFGGVAEGEALRRALGDFDPAIAGRAALIVEQLLGRPVEADPRPLPHPRVPLPAELRGMDRAILVMADGGRIELALLPESAPTNVARFVAMARAGWFDDLTFHRVVPNFVVQGGSPGANEYAGGARFTRDEVGGSHRRGAVGVSTRGRDTGDGQIFINLVDNIRLDHDYTVIGTVVAGWEVLDRLVEGAVIARVELPDP